MKKSILKIKNNNIVIKEAEFKIEDIFATTGLQRAASQLVQTAKILSATAKLMIKLVLSFRSLSLQKIIRNMESANKEYDIRVRTATRKITSSISEMGSESKIGSVFALSVPSAGLVNYLRTEIDNEGGLYYYLKSNDQNLLVGDLFADAYDTFDKFTDDLLHTSTSGKDKPRYDSKRQQEREIKKAQKEFLKGIRKEYGPRAEKIYEQIFNGEDSPETDAVKLILGEPGAKQYKTQEGQAKALDNYLKSLRESKLKTFIIREKKNKSSESDKKIALLFLYAIGMKSKSLTDVISAKSNIDSEIEKNLSQDINQYEDLLVSFLFDLFIAKCMNEYLVNKSKDFNSILESLKSNFLSSLKNKEKSSDFEKSSKSLIDKVKSIDDNEMYSFFILLLEDMKKNNILKNSNFKSFYKNLDKLSNSQDKDFLVLKDNVDKIIKEVMSFNINETENIILDKINKLKKES